MAQKMTDERWRAFVSAGTRTAKLSTVRADGRPHIAPIWFLLDGEDLVFTTDQGSVKGRNLVREPRVSFCVDDDRPPFAFVVLEARVERVSEDLDELVEWATRISGRYMGQDRADEYGRRNGVPGELLVRARITRVTALDAVAG